ncbi:hypothetical protein F4780DRAFT_771271 [Xylariomycetidae sp. FL0641]|nr:hypothetical protein F4780DRAFT_771271 [Xylariomycetidae sp. FL0641]
MSAATKKPLSSTPGRVASSDNSATPSPARQRRSPPPTSTTGATNTPPAGRRGSTRTGAPVSARAAANHRSSSSMSISNVTDADARAETVALIEDLKERLQKADAAAEQNRKQGEVLQSRLDDALKEQAKMEERVHESEEQIESLRNEKREAARQMREMEAIYEAERSSMMKEKEEMSNREEELQSVINRLKENLNQRNAEDENRPTRQSTASPSMESGNFAPPSSVQRSDSRNTSKLILQKDKLIESLRLELAEAQIKLVETENQGGGRLQEVERLLMEARMANARLMEDNEGYQLLLQKKTLHGEFGIDDLSYMGGVSANEDALNALEGRPSTGDDKGQAVSSLADELGAAGDVEATEELNRRLESELRATKDQNKALTLYINKIIERLLSHQEFEHILDQSADFKPEQSPSANVHKDLPPPPASETPGVGASLLQRAKSMATGGAGAAPSRPKQRPLTMMPPPSAPQYASAHSNPETAPSIPIGPGRAASTRHRVGRPMSDQYTSGSAAGIVNAMYKGPDSEGPLSPTLSNKSARNSRSFFTPGPGTGTPRVASASGAPASAGNFPGMRSETSSLSA